MRIVEVRRAIRDLLRKQAAVKRRQIGKAWLASTCRCVRCVSDEDEVLRVMVDVLVEQAGLLRWGSGEDEQLDWAGRRKTRDHLRIEVS